MNDWYVQEIRKKKSKGKGLTLFELIYESYGYSPGGTMFGSTLVIFEEPREDLRDLSDFGFKEVRFTRK